MSTANTPIYWGCGTMLFIVALLQELIIRDKRGRHQMIVLPTIPAIVAALAAIVEAALVGAGIGGLFSAGAGAVGEVVTGVQEHGAINQAVVENVVQNAPADFAEGALVGGVFGGVTVVAGPVINAVGSAAKPVLSVVDDAAKPALNAIDDVARPVLSRIGNAAKSVSGGVTSAYNRVLNALNARFYNRLPKTTGTAGYVYVMDDVATAGRYKIGMTHNPAQRLPQVQTKVGNKVNYSCIIPRDNMRLLESTLHSEFAGQRLPNFGTGIEWFKLNASQLAAACSR